MDKEEHIKPYHLVKPKGCMFPFFHYLHIQGGAGRKDGTGGQYNFYLTYLPPDDERTIDVALDHWCKDRKIPCGVGDTISEAYNDFQHQLIRLPLK